MNATIVAHSSPGRVTSSARHPRSRSKIAEERPAYRPQRISLPEGARRIFGAASIASFAGFAVFGLFTSLAPTVLSGTLHETSRLVAGLVTFAVFAASAVSQVALAGIPQRAQLRASLGLVVGGLIALAASVLRSDLPLFDISGVLAGAGVGLLFKSSIAVAASLAVPDRRGEVLAAIFLIAYTGLALPALIVGLALALLPVVPVLVTFVTVTGALMVWGGAAMLVTVGRVVR
jgi:hypothetical protein